jgi:hypothetical protein
MDIVTFGSERELFLFAVFTHHYDFLVPYRWSSVFVGISDISLHFLKRSSVFHGGE